MLVLQQDEAEKKAREEEEKKRKEEEAAKEAEEDEGNDEDTLVSEWFVLFSYFSNILQFRHKVSCTRELGATSTPACHLTVESKISVYASCCSNKMFAAFVRCHTYVINM